MRKTRKTNINLEVTIAHAPPRINWFDASVVRQEGLHVYDIDKGERVCVSPGQRSTCDSYPGEGDTWVVEKGFQGRSCFGQHLESYEEQVDERALGVKYEVKEIRSSYIRSALIPDIWLGMRD